MTATTRATRPADESTVVTAWSEIVGPPSLPAAEVAAIEKAITDLEQ